MSNSNSSSDEEIEQVSFSQSKLLILKENLKQKQNLDLKKQKRRETQSRNLKQKEQAESARVRVRVRAEEHPSDDVDRASTCTDVGHVGDVEITSNVKISTFKDIKVPFNKNLLELRKQRLGVFKRAATLKYKKFC
jgi:hypothetical protein